MKITNNTNGTISISTPYSAEFVSRIKTAGGKWNSSNKTWEMDARAIETARAIMREVYGADDTPQEMVDVKITVGKDDIEEYTDAVTIFGKAIASARGRDSGARVGDGVVLESGSVKSGGSMKNWKTIIAAGSVLTVYDVPKQAVENGMGWVDWYGSYEIIAQADPKATLRAEKEALLQRLAEIESLLEQ